MSKSVKFVKIVSPIALAIALTACGGGSTTFGSGGTTGGGTTQTQQVNSIELSVSSRLLDSDGSSPITITAIAKDANNNAIDDADIIFSVDQDATILKDATVTTTVDPDDPTATPVTTVVTAGSVQTATLIPGSPENKTLNVTVSSGGQSETIAVEVIGTTVTIDGPQAITVNKESPFVLKLKNSSNKAITFETVELTSANGNTITTDSNYQTDSEGEISFSINGIVSGTDIITAKVLGLTTTKNIQVSGDEFALSAGSNEININTLTTISFVWKKNGVPVPGQTISLSATRGDIVSQTDITDASGNASFVISSATAGQTVISATTADGLSTTLEREFVAVTPAYLNTQADPTLIGPNGSSSIISIIRDINDNPVKNKIINFRLQDTVDGTLSASTAVTDSLGRASISYKAGNSSSAKDGVVINTFIQGYPAVPSDEVKLTVGGNAVRITLGDDNEIVENDPFYTKLFGVIVTDSAGNPIPNQQVSFTITPTTYYKGTLWFDVPSGTWTRVSNPPIGGLTAICPSEDLDNDGNLDTGEDINNNGILDQGEDLDNNGILAINEDTNRNGALEPTHDASVTSSGVTDAGGRIIVQVVYPQNTAWWSDQRIESSTTVNGTDYIEHTEFLLPVLAADVIGDDTSPPNLHSPYGTFGNCTDDPDGSPPPPPVPPVVYKVIDAFTGGDVDQLVHNVWYSIAGDGVILTSNEYALSDDTVIIEQGPNNTFRLKDKNPDVDDSGFFINLTVGGQTIPLFYRDNSTGQDAPIINLTGLENMSILINSTYVEQGANAVDAVDNILPVTIFGFVDTSKVGTYTLIYRATDSFGSTTTVFRTVSVIEDTLLAPVITLNGSPTITLTVGDAYIELGATAVDDLDGNVTGSIVISGIVDTATAGTYSVNYTASDSSGNTAFITRIITVNP